MSTVLKTIRENAHVIHDDVSGNNRGIPLSNLLIDSKAAKLTTNPKFLLNIGNFATKPALYLISMKGQTNRGYFKMGMSGSNVLRRWCAYKTSLPVDGDIIVHACLSLPNKFHAGKGSVAMVIGVFESIMKANLRKFAEQLRNTEWFRKGSAQLINMAIATHFMEQILDQLAYGLPNDKFVLHMYNLRLYKLSETLDKVRSIIKLEY